MIPGRPGLTHIYHIPADYDCIVRAEREVVLATNYWQPSNSVNKISSALMDLSKLVGEQKREKIVVKIMWDRGQFSQLIDNHPFVTQEGMEALDLPRPDEIPNIDLQVIVRSRYESDWETKEVSPLLTR